MELIEFSVSNYRSITSAHKIPCKDVTVLLGRNNEGKSNLLRALDVAMNLLKQHSTKIMAIERSMYLREKIYVWERDFPIQLQNKAKDNQTILRLEFLLNSQECVDFKESIGSSINGNLLVEVKIGQDHKPAIRAIKKGKNTKSLRDKSPKIAKFVADRIHFNYIPAVRIDNTTIELISHLLSQELKQLELDKKYISALEAIKECQEPILNGIATRVHGPLKEFLPNIESVKVEISESSRRYSLRRDVDIIIDDGTPTSLEHKGDGVKSLAALGLLKDQSAPDGASILAIEEPESHLHPAAIHQVNDIIRSMTPKSQVIITTHNPLFVDRKNINANIVVSESKAVSAKNIEEIRNIFGIRASDNLINANYVLLVEGNEDKKSLEKLLPTMSDKVAKALKNNMLVIDSLGGASKLSIKLSIYQNLLCSTYVLLDDDSAGKCAYERATKDSLISTVNCTFTKCQGMTESEFEDCIDPNIYFKKILEETGVDLKIKKSSSKIKWSDRFREASLSQGKFCNDDLIVNAKRVVSKAVAANPKNALSLHKRHSIDALVTALERMIKN